MNMTVWNPLREMDDLYQSYHRALARTRPHEGMLSTDWTPSVDITENDSEFLMKAELPEVKKEDIDIHVNHAVLTLSGERRSETRDEKNTVWNVFMAVLRVALPCRKISGKLKLRP